MIKNNGSKWFGASLTLLAVVLVIVGVRAITSLQTVMTKVFIAEPRSSVELMVSAWPDFVLQLAVCLSVASGMFLIAAFLAFTGKLTLSHKVKS